MNPSLTEITNEHVNMKLDAMNHELDAKMVQKHYVKQA